MLAGTSAGNRNQFTGESKFWKFIKDTSKGSGLSAHMYLGTDEVHSGQETTDLFARPFATVYSSSPKFISEFDYDLNININDSLISLSDVFSAI